MLEIGSNIFYVCIMLSCPFLLDAIYQKDILGFRSVARLRYRMAISLLLLGFGIYCFLIANGFTPRDISQHIFFLKLFIHPDKMPMNPTDLLKHVIK